MIWMLLKGAVSLSSLAVAGLNLWLGASRSLDARLLTATSLLIFIAALPWVHVLKPSRALGLTGIVLALLVLGIAGHDIATPERFPLNCSTRLSYCYVQNIFFDFGGTALAAAPFLLLGTYMLLASLRLTWRQRHVRGGHWWVRIPARSTGPTPHGSAAQPGGGSLREKIVEGEIWINGLNTYAKISLYTNQTLLVLSDEKHGIFGPEIYINFDSAALDACIGDGTTRELIFPVSGPNIGQIHECTGYAAMDIGYHTRMIESLTMTISREVTSTRFVLEGQTGLLVPASVEGGISDQLRQSKGIFDFRIWFDIPDSDLLTYFKTPQALAAMARSSSGVASPMVAESQSRSTAPVENTQ